MSGRCYVSTTPRRSSSLSSSEISSKQLLNNQQKILESILDKLDNQASQINVLTDKIEILEKSQAIDHNAGCMKSKKVVKDMLVSFNFFSRGINDN